eukprot:CAMPEP_0113844144 /NCGR_PEP_ID=MMETSP0372-20130328/89_1 /TAXON_ID=340204 /ORGANISM="Lankesteria abbotti" /LENGTH=373 /DNA_ID=CAMNT_0000813145 /DNA_START=39 /DNA_END=1160 /DNA_ORIENTATION=- /assembly_acc=CAM_ASM_000359
MTERVLICQGAEARIYACQFLGRPAILKERFAKSYRHPVLDGKLTKQRVVSEARNIGRCRKAGVDAPVVYGVDVGRGQIWTERIDGDTIKQLLQKRCLEKKQCLEEKKLQHSNHDIAELAREIGINVAKMHSKNLVHGDLTTSNVIVRRTPNQFTKTQSCSSVDITMDQNAMETSDKNAMETSDKNAMETSEQNAMETSEQNAMETSDKNAMETSEQNAMETSEQNAMETSDKNAVETSEQNAMETSEQNAVENTLEESEGNSSQDPVTVDSDSRPAKRICVSRTHCSTVKSAFQKWNVVVIDLGLSYTTPMPEDKAVDLYVLERALASTHPEETEFFSHFLDGYCAGDEKRSAVMKKLDEVRLRGRKRVMVG